MKIWFKEWCDNHLIQDVVIDKDGDDTRTHKIFGALEDACAQLDLGRPIWLESTIAQFKRNGKARFTQDSFIEEIPFDYLEIHVIEED